MSDHTWGSWTAYRCPFCTDGRFYKGRGGQRAHIRIKHPREYEDMVRKELRLPARKEVDDA